MASEKALPLVVKNCFLEFRETSDSPVEHRLRSFTDPSGSTGLFGGVAAPYMSPLLHPKDRLDSMGLESLAEEGGLSEASTDEPDPNRSPPAPSTATLGSAMPEKVSPVSTAAPSPFRQLPADPLLLGAGQVDNPLLGAPWGCGAPGYNYDHMWMMPPPYGYGANPWLLPPPGMGLPTPEDFSEAPWGLLPPPGIGMDPMTVPLSTGTFPLEDKLRTTAMLRNLPPEYTSKSLLDLLDQEGFSGKYDFVYLPSDFRFGTSFGYGFINFVSNDAAEEFREHFNGFCKWSKPSDKVAEVCWSEPLQGLEAHIQRYRNSPMMHDTVSDVFKPMIFVNGVRAEFPPPTKKLKPPRMRHARGEVAPEDA